MRAQMLYRALLVGAAGAAVLLATPAGAQTSRRPARVQVYRDVLTPVGNNPAARASAVLLRRGDALSVSLTGTQLSPSLPHAVHIHGEHQAANECPGIEADGNADGLVDTVEGLPAYGGIQTTFTTSGGTSGGLAPDALDLSRAPMASAGGSLIYRRTIPITDTVAPGQIGVPRAVADNLTDFHIVVHGADLNGNGEYDFGPGTSPLSASVGAPVPLEAELPVACGQIRR